MSGSCCSQKSKSQVVVEIDEKVADCLRVMEQHAHIPQSKIVETALRRYIATHKDYLPADYELPASRNGNE